LGFILTMNRGMRLHEDRDVVWLNSDTLVHGDWLDRLLNAAYSHPNIASACPLSNNGELVSFPKPSICHPMPDQSELSYIDALAKRRHGKPAMFATACGFGVYTERDARNEVGYLDESELLRGYGEETDWFLRAQQAGWTHVAATNIFVAHRGGVSFKD